MLSPFTDSWTWSDRQTDAQMAIAAILGSASSSERPVQRVLAGQSLELKKASIMQYENPKKEPRLYGLTLVDNAANMERRERADQEQAVRTSTEHAPTNQPLANW